MVYFAVKDELIIVSLNVNSKKDYFEKIYNYYSPFITKIIKQLITQGKTIYKFKYLILSSIEQF